MRRGLGIAIVFTVLMAATVLIITLTIPSLMAQATSLLDQEPALRALLAKWLAGSHLTSPLSGLLRKVHSGDLVRMAASNALRILHPRHRDLRMFILSSMFLALYIMIDRDRLRGGLFLVVPRSQHIRLSRIMLNLETIVGGYIRGQIDYLCFMAVFVFILLNVLRCFKRPGHRGVCGLCRCPALHRRPAFGRGCGGGSRSPAALHVIIVVLVLMLFTRYLRVDCSFPGSMAARCGSHRP